MRNELRPWAEIVSPGGHNELRPYEFVCSFTLNDLEPEQHVSLTNELMYLIENFRIRDPQINNFIQQKLQEAVHHSKS